MNQKGFTAVEGLLVILVLSVIGFGGYFVWNRQKSPVQDKNASTQTQSDEKNSKDEEAAKRYTSTLYPDLSFTVPTGWEVTEPTTYDDPSWPDGKLSVSDGKTTLQFYLWTVRVTGFEGYSCSNYPTVVKVGDVYRFVDKEGKIFYKDGITSTDSEWPAGGEQEFYNFEDPNPNYCVSFPFIGTYKSKSNQKDYPDKSYGFEGNEKILVWLDAEVKGDSSEGSLKMTDEIIKSLSDSVEIN